MSDHAARAGRRRRGGSGPAPRTVHAPTGSSVAARPDPLDDLVEVDRTGLADRLRDIAARYFDGNHYVDLYQDVRRARTNDPKFDLLEHFICHGAQEGRSPSILFDISYVQHRLSRIDRIDVPNTAVFCHFAGTPDVHRFVPNRWFSPWAFRKLYADRYPELDALSDYAVFEFYLDHQDSAALSPNGVFNEERYRRCHPDVAVAVGQGDHRSGFLHYARHGAIDARTSLPGARKHTGPDAPPGEHAWIMCGQGGLTNVVWWFDEAFYLSVYPDVHDLVRRAIVKSGLEHYLVVGFKESRVPCPAMFVHLPQDTGRCAWEYLSEICANVRPDTFTVAMEEACAIHRYLEQRGQSRSARQITDALWPYVTTPRMGGTFDAKRYLAAHPDVAKAVGMTAENAAEVHYREHGVWEQRVTPGSNLFADRSLTFQDMLDWKSGVNFFGPISISSGLGNAARGYIAALRAVGIAVDVYDTSALIRAGLPADLFCAKDLNYLRVRDLPRISVHAAR
jgi:hypothetical protein